MAQPNLMGIAQENPFTVLFTVIGAVIGFLLPSGLDILAQVNFIDVSCRVHDLMS